MSFTVWIPKFVLHVTATLLLILTVVAIYVAASKKQTKTESKAELPARATTSDYDKLTGLDPQTQLMIDWRARLQTLEDKVQRLEFQLGSLGSEPIGMGPEFKSVLEGEDEQ